MVIEALMSIRIGSPSVGMPTAIGSGVSTAFRPPNGATRGHRRVGAGDDDHQPAVGGPLQERREAADVVAAADDDRRDAVVGGPVRGQVDGPGGQPDAGQPAGRPR